MIQSYVALDLETTGLRPGDDRIIEIGAIKVIDGKMMDKYVTFVEAGREIAPYIQKLTGITPDMMSDAVSQGRAIRELISFCEELPILGHNIIFDYSFLKQSAVNEQLEFECLGIDTLKIAKKHLPGLEKRSLDFLCDYYQIYRDHSHRAYDDAGAAKILYELLADKFYDQDASVFQPAPLIWKAKKQSSITKAQKVYLIDLLKYHRIEIAVEVDALTKSEASKYIDQIILKHGRIKRGV